MNRFTIRYKPNNAQGDASFDLYAQKVVVRHPDEKIQSMLTVITDELGSGASFDITLHGELKHITEWVYVAVEKPVDRFPVEEVKNGPTR